HRGSRLGHPASDRLPALRAPRQALVGPNSRGHGGLADEPLQRRLRRSGLRGTVSALPEPGAPPGCGGLLGARPGVQSELLVGGERPEGIRPGGAVRRTGHDGRLALAGPPGREAPRVRIVPVRLRGRQPCLHGRLRTCPRRSRTHGGAGHPALAAARYGGGRRVLRRAASLPLPAVARAGASAARLGRPADARGILQGGLAPGVLGPCVAGRSGRPAGHRGELPPELPRGAHLRRRRPRAAADRSRYRIAEDFGTAVLQSLPPGAHLAGADDNVLFTLMYLHLVERRRPDVDLIMQGVGGMELPPLRFDPENDPLFFTHHPNWDHPLLDVVPVGLVFRVWPARRPPPPAAATAEALDGERDPRVPKDDLTRSLIGHFHYMRGVTFARGDWPRARREFALAGATADDDDVLFYNLGLVFQRNGLLEDALAAFRRSHAINPRHLASQRRPRATDRVAELTAEEKRLEAIEEDLVRDPTPLPLAPDTPAYP